MVAVPGALLAFGIVSIPFSSNTALPALLPFVCASAPSLSFEAAAAALPPTDLAPKLSGTGFFFLGPPDAPEVAFDATEGGTADEMLDVLPLCAIIDSASLAGVSVPPLAPSESDAGVGAGLEATRLGPRMGNGSGSTGSGASAFSLRPSPLKFLFLRMGVAMVLRWVIAVRSWRETKDRERGTTLIDAEIEIKLLH